MIEALTIRQVPLVINASSESFPIRSLVLHPVSKLFQSLQLSLVKTSTFPASSIAVALHLNHLSFNLLLELGHSRVKQE